MRHRILFLLLSAAAFCFADDVAAPAAQDSPPPPEVVTAADPADSSEAPSIADEPDSVAIYRNLIKQENAQADYKSSLAGIVAGAGLAIGGGIWFAAAYDRHQTWKRDFDARMRARPDTLPISEIFTPLGDAIEASGHKVTFAVEGFMSLSIALAGAAIFGFSVKAYNSRKAHAAKRDEYQDSLERLQRRREEEERNSAQVLLVPTVDVANSGAGLNLAILF